jgi:tetraacyldisaccharide 4'-kinase
MNITDLVNPYAYVMKLRRFLYHKGIFKYYTVPIPVISIGNLSVGGTGKTPVTLALAKYCGKIQGKKTAIILRGYKRKSSGYLLVSDGDTILESVERSGDEAQIYAKELQGAIIICDEDRVRGAREAVSLGAEVILLDDGFQHIRLQRDLNILLINSDESIPAVLPFGRGRETISAVRDADIIITNSGNKTSVTFYGKAVIQSQSTIRLLDLYTATGASTSSIEILRGKQILALSGIANPVRFEKSLVPYSEIIVPYSLRDHTEYDSFLVEKIILKAKNENCDMIVTTTKDAVKMLNLYRALQQKDSSLPPLAVVKSEIEFVTGKELLFSSINDLFEK